MAVRRRILDAAMNLFTRQGFENVSMRRIADQIGYSAAAIYRYFPGKRDILGELRLEAFERFLAFQRSVAERYADPVERLRQGGLGYLRFARQRPEDYLIMFALGPMEEMVGELDQDQAPMQSFLLLEKNCRECLDTGLFPGMDARTLALSLWSSVHGLVSLLQSQRMDVFVPADQEEAFMNRLIDFMMRPGGPARQSEERP